MKTTAVCIGMEPPILTEHSFSVDKKATGQNTKSN
nr:MAG TPA: hypothetical protein [Caudoviricetes sp.]